MAEAAGTLEDAPDPRAAAEAAVLAAARAYAAALDGTDARTFNKAKADLLTAAQALGKD